ncbi:MAG: hypothetical protein KDD51_10645 [Bdellovibrionales bacterium]|nr:hypothetical protein [Bdellovibrionales bacterium]
MNYQITRRFNRWLFQVAFFLVGVSVANTAQATEITVYGTVRTVLSSSWFLVGDFTGPIAAYGSGANRFFYVYVGQNTQVESGAISAGKKIVIIRGQ